MQVVDGSRYDELVARLALSPARYTTRITERIREEVAPARLEPVLPDLREVLDRLVPAVLAALLTSEPLDEEAMLVVRRAAERWSSRAVPFSTVMEICTAASRAAVEVTQDVARERDQPVVVQVVGRGVVIAQEVVAAAAAGHERNTRRELATDRSDPGRGWAPIVLRGPAADVLALVAEGRTNAQVAGELGISPQAVNYHVGRLMRALGAVNRTAVVARAYERGLLPR